VALAVELITPIAMEKELRFAIREGGGRWAQESSATSWNSEPKTVALRKDQRVLPSFALHKEAQFLAV